MDTYHRFHSHGTYWLMRAEHLTIVLLGSLLVLWHYTELNWLRFIVVLVIIDLLGYLPGAIAYRRAQGVPIHPWYHYLYNFMHSYLTWLPLIALWSWNIGGWEWAMLAVPIHLSGDRGIFGNVFKPIALPFEPVAGK